MVRPSVVLSLGAAVFIDLCTNNVAAEKVYKPKLTMERVASIRPDLGIQKFESVAFKPSTGTFWATFDNIFNGNSVNAGEPESGVVIFKMEGDAYMQTIQDFTVGMEESYPTSVAYSEAHDQLAIAIAPRDPLKLGKLYVFPNVEKWEKCHFCDSHYYVLSTGYRPKMVTFTPDGQHILVANEGVPLDYTCKFNDPEGSVTIYKKKHSPHHSRGTYHNDDKYEACTADFRRFDEPWHTDAMKRRGVRVTGVGFTKFSQDMEPEHIAVSHDSKTAYVTLQENNAIAKIDIKKCEVEDVLPLGYKEWGRAGLKLDASNDEAADLKDWPMVKSMFMPDNIVTFKAKGETFLVVANEGATRKYGVENSSGFYTDMARVRILARQVLRADLTGSPGSGDGTDIDPDLIDEKALGRLEVTTKSPFANNFKELYAFGARSISIFTTKGKLVWDSGDFIEKYTATGEDSRYSTIFNSRFGNPALMDTASPSRGPAPKGLAIAEIHGRTFVFVGLSTVGGWMCWDISHPYHPKFQSYVNPFEDTSSRDKSPHSALVISKADAPRGDKPALIASNKKSGSIAIYQLTLGY